MIGRQSRNTGATAIIVEREEQGETLSKLLPGGVAEKLQAGLISRVSRSARDLACQSASDSAECGVVAGEAFGHTYQDSTVFRRVMVRYTDGTVTYHQVEYIQPLPGTESSVVRVIEPLPVDELTPQTVLGISWLLVARFAVDRMDIDFLTNGVAEFSIAMKTLENFEL